MRRWVFPGIFRAESSAVGRASIAPVSPPAGSRVPIWVDLALDWWLSSAIPVSELNLLARPLSFEIATGGWVVGPVVMAS